MGRYVNPGSEGFRRISKRNYIDKTGLIALVNDRIGTAENLICISRPRRFGKTYAANTLCAYYDCSVDSHELFDRFEIAKADSYEEHINKYNVIRLDITEFISAVSMGMSRTGDVVNDIVQGLIKDIKKTYPKYSDENNLYDILTDIVDSDKEKKKFIFIIDEWDAIIREYSENSELQKRYLEFLRGFFKNASFTSEYTAAAYMTGILPIKKVKSQSAISDFTEYTALSPGEFTKYIGFNENEIGMICEKYDLDIKDMKKWYDGYTFGNVSGIYNPYSVMNAAKRGEFASYWRQTSAAESLQSFIEMDYDGLQQRIAELISGEEVPVITRTFKNDFRNFSNKDDVLTLMIHLGYLTYNKATGCARIPNEELQTEFNDMLRITRSTKLIAYVNRSKQILNDTLNGNEQAVADAIDMIREENYAPAFYNNEQALRSAIKLAYLAAIDNFVDFEELASGKGLADIVYLPQRSLPYPAMIIELKRGKTAEIALEQIKQRDYKKAIENFGGDILLVGINYDDKEKKHQCRIEKITV